MGNYTKLDELNEEDLLSELFYDELADFEPLPSYAISGSGFGWFLNPKLPNMVKVRRGIEIIPLTDDLDHLDRILVSSPFGFLLIPKDEVQEIGWN